MLMSSPVSDAEPASDGLYSPAGVAEAASMEVRSATLSLAIAFAALLAAGPAPAQLARVDELQVSYGLRRRV
jgi:hypothetical protein